MLFTEGDRCEFLLKPDFSSIVLPPKDCEEHFISVNKKVIWEREAKRKAWKKEKIPDHRLEYVL